MKLDVLISVFFGSKMKLAVVSLFYGTKIMKPPDSVGNKMKLTAAAQPRAVSFILFPDRSLAVL